MNKNGIKNFFTRSTFLVDKFLCVAAYKIPKKFDTPILSNAHYAEIMTE